MGKGSTHPATVHFHMPTLADLTTFLDRRLPLPGRPAATLVIPHEGDVARLGLRLDPGGDLPAWARQHALDAIFLHRHYRLDATSLPLGVGVIAAHDAFDVHLSVGDNAHWARAVGLRTREAFGEKNGRSLGRIGAVAPRGWKVFCEEARHEFGGIEEMQPPASGRVTRVAVVGAMTEELVREAHAAGVDVYVTGQFRQPAREAAAETGIGVIAVGHRRAERWGLRQLATLLDAEFPALTVVS